MLKHTRPRGLPLLLAPLPSDDESVDLRLRAVLVVWESGEPEMRELGSCALLCSREEVA